MTVGMIKTAYPQSPPAPQIGVGDATPNACPMQGRPSGENMMRQQQSGGMNKQLTKYGFCCG